MLRRTFLKTVVAVGAGAIVGKAEASGYTKAHRPKGATGRIEVVFEDEGFLPIMNLDHIQALQITTRHGSFWGQGVIEDIHREGNFIFVGFRVVD